MSRRPGATNGHAPNGNGYSSREAAGAKANGRWRTSRESSKDAKPEAEEVVYLCHVHPDRSAAGFCGTCEQSVCADCRASAEHAGHTIESCEAGHRKLRKWVEQTSVAAQGFVDELTRRLEALPTLKARVESIAALKIDMVDTLCNQAIESANRARTIMTARILQAAELAIDQSAERANQVRSTVAASRAGDLSSPQVSKLTAAGAQVRALERLESAQISLWRTQLLLELDDLRKMEFERKKRRNDEAISSETRSQMLATWDASVPAAENDSQMHTVLSSLFTTLTPNEVDQSYTQLERLATASALLHSLHTAHIELTPSQQSIPLRYASRMDAASIALLYAASSDTLLLTDALNNALVAIPKPSARLQRESNEPIELHAFDGQLRGTGHGETKPGVIFRSVVSSNSRDGRHNTGEVVWRDLPRTTPEQLKQRRLPDAKFSQIAYVAIPERRIFYEFSLGTRIARTFWFDVGTSKWHEVGEQELAASVKHVAYNARQRMVCVLYETGAVQLLSMDLVPVTSAGQRRNAFGIELPDSPLDETQEAREKRLRDAWNPCLVLLTDECHVLVYNDADRCVYVFDEAGRYLAASRVPHPVRVWCAARARRLFLLDDRDAISALEIS